LGSQVFDVRTALTTPGEHEGHLDEDLAPVVQWESLTARSNTRRERSSEPQLVA
jgi:hypothetical protein